jgi:uncharacterized protein YndB with AHSA1/START domain
VLINRPSQVVYEALVSPQVLDNWWTQGTVIDLRVGGKFRLCWRSRPQEPDCEAKGQYLAIVPGQRLVWRWLQKDRTQEQEEVSQVVLNLDRTSVGTVLTLNQSSSDDDGLIPGLGITWCESLAVLKFYLEHACAYHIGVVGSPKYLSKAMLSDLSFLR